MCKKKSVPQKANIHHGRHPDTHLNECLKLNLVTVKQKKKEKKKQNKKIYDSLLPVFIV